MNNMERKISKSISRLINTAQYENVTITINIEESISGKSEKDIEEALVLLTKKVVEDYKNTESMVFDELELGNKPAYTNRATLPKNQNVDFKEIFDT